MLLLKGLSHVATFDDEGREFTDVDILLDGPMISSIGRDLPTDNVDKVIDGKGLIALPGLINSHQHLSEGMLRAIPKIERATMSQWLSEVLTTGERWWKAGRLDASAIHAVARAVLLESLLGGVTTVADQHVLFPGGKHNGYVEATIDAARDVGIRFHAARGSTTLGKSAGGFCDDMFVEDVDSVVGHCLELLDSYHDGGRFGLTRIALAPCGVTYDKPELFEAYAELADEHDLRLHTHLYQPPDVALCEQLYGMTPWQFMEKHGWANPRVWGAHAVSIPRDEIPQLADAGVSVAHLAAPDLRMGWGLAPVRAFLDAGVTVGFGTTGSASNDGANMLGDLRLAALAHRPADPDNPERWLSARELFRMATRGSAECLGRDDIGAIEVGRAADISCWDVTGVDRVGVHDPLIGLIMTGLSDRANLVLVNGEVLVKGGEPTRETEAEITRRAWAVVPPIGS